MQARGEWLALGWGSGRPMVAEPIGARRQADEIGSSGGVPGGGAMGGSPLGEGSGAWTVGGDW